MTIPSTVRKAGPFSGTGAQTVFPFTFKTFTTGDVAVTIADSDGVETLLDGAAYTVSLNSNQETSPGGTITYPLSGSPLATGSRLVITSDLDYDQPLDLPSGGNFSPLALENELDRLVMQLQQLAEQYSRALRYNVTTAGTSPIFPSPSANKLLAWNSGATALTNADVADLSEQFVFADWRYKTFAGDGSDVTFELDDDPANIANVLVSVDGLALVPTVDYTLFGNILTFTTAPGSGAEILVRYGRAVAQREIFHSITKVTATAAQTVFTVSYTPGVGSLAVYVNGLRMEGAGIDYTETSATSITFVSGLQSGDSVVFVVGAEVNDSTGERVTSFNSRTGSVALTSADVINALVATSATKDVIWNSVIPGAVNAGDASCIYLQRNADYTGGTFGYVRSAMYLETFTPTGTHSSFEWGLTSVLHSRSVVSGSGPSAAPQNVALNGTVFRTAGNAPVWAGNFAAYDTSGAYSASNGPLHGLEINVGGNGTDIGENTIGVFIVPQLRAEVAGPGAASFFTGILVHGDASANWRNGITNQAGSVFGYLDRGTHAVAIDLSTSTNSQAAIRIKGNDWIALEATNNIKLRYNSSTGFIEFYNSGTRRGYLDIGTGADVNLSKAVTLDTVQTISALKTFTGGVDVNGITCQNGMALGAAGTVQWNALMTVASAVAGAATLPANPVGFVKILIDGTERRVPYYSA